ncbi:MAG: UDP-N-acetylmuramate dehydrogenase [Verrucomicrobia bacterium]|nr:UDP-N-acetylmuramate dehydrogenase [Verrucomicrobiota bacterium]MCH8528400.1 UDP-N-acetylmuramate dehydrogenase [Kiritimatiellia bacterium]
MTQHSPPFKTLQSHPDITVEAGIPLSTCGTFQVGGPAKILITCGTPEALAKVRALAAELPPPLAFIGAGSNILFADTGWPGTLVRYTTDTFTPPRPLPDGSWRVNAAIQLDALAAWACDQGIKGWEAFSGIPGTVGGAVVGNAGAWGVQMEHMLCAVHGWDAAGQPRDWTADDCAFTYRDSRLKHDGSWVGEITLLPLPGDPQQQQTERARILALRAEKHPDWRTTPCIGSFFKNIQPSSAAERRQAAGWFLEQVGAKTETEGGAAVYEKHANILIKAAPTCTATDVHRLALRLQQRVHEKFNIQLEREIQTLGF